MTYEEFTADCVITPREAKTFTADAILREPTFTEALWMVSRMLRHYIQARKEGRI